MSAQLTSIIGPFKPTNYDLALDIDHTKKNFTGKAIISFTKSSSSLNTQSSHDNDPFKVTLNSSGLVILSATIAIPDTDKNNEKANIKYLNDLQRVELSFANLTQAQVLTSFQITIKYIGKINRINTFRDKTSGLFITNYSDMITGKASNTIMATQSQPCDSRSIFPCVDELAARASIQLTLTLSSTKFQALSSADVENEQVLENGKMLIKFKRTEQMVISLFSFVIGDLDFLEDEVTLPGASEAALGQKVPIKVYTLKGASQQARYALNVTKHFLPYLAAKLQQPYPATKLDLVGLPFLSNGAVENWGLVNVQQSILLVADENDAIAGNLRNKTRQLNQIIVHEIAHQWFGNLVSFDSWEHYWLNEALATFLAYVVVNECDFANGGANTTNGNGNVAKYSNVDYQTIWTEQAISLESTFESDAAVVGDDGDDSGLSISQISNAVQNINVDGIDKTFDAASYEKAIHLLRMLMNVFENENGAGSKGQFDDSSDFFFKALGQLVEKYNHQAIKPVDYWVFLNDVLQKQNQDKNKDQSNKFNLTNFIVSWIKLPGFPIVSVSLTKEGLIKVEQHRYTIGQSTVNDNNKGKTNNHEDYIYHVPLAIRTTDGTVFNWMLTERSKIFTNEELPAAKFVKINANRTGYFKVNYESASFYETIGANLSKLSKLDIVGVLLDIESSIGNSEQQSKIAVDGFYQITKAITNEGNKAILSKNFEALEVVLRIAQYLGSAIQLTKPAGEFKQFKSNFLKPLAKQLFQNLDSWPVNYSDAKYKYSRAEIASRSAIIIIGVEDPDITNYAAKLFKHLNHGPKKSVARELVSAVLANFSYNCKDTKSFKKLLQDTTRSVEPCLANIDNLLDPESAMAVTELQSAAVSALGFTRDEQNFKKVLNYIATNIDSKGIELALVGFNYFEVDEQANNKSNKHKQMAWEWLQLHFDQWASRSLREGSEYSQQLFKTLQNLLITVFKTFDANEGSADQQAVQRFVNAKGTKFQAHKLEQLWKGQAASRARDMAAAELVAIGQWKL